MSAKKPAECVKVVLRCRPLNSQEKKDERKKIVHMDQSRGSVTLRNDKANEQPKDFTFDAVFDETCTQEGIYKETCAPIVECVLEGYNGTVFAYGQTGTGKTFSMEGVANDPVLKGIIPRTFEHIFESIAMIDSKEFLVRASYIEIYNEDIRDLLKKDPVKLELKETNVRPLTPQPPPIPVSFSPLRAQPDERCCRVLPRCAPELAAHCWRRARRRTPGSTSRT